MTKSEWKRANSNDNNKIFRRRSLQKLDFPEGRGWRAEDCRWVERVHPTPLTSTPLSGASPPLSYRAHSLSSPFRASAFFPMPKVLAPSPPLPSRPTSTSKERLSLFRHPVTSGKVTELDRRQPKSESWRRGCEECYSKIIIKSTEKSHNFWLLIRTFTKLSCIRKSRRRRYLISSVFLSPCPCPLPWPPWWLWFGVDSFL